MKHFALITGGAGGIGLSFAKICALEGYRLLLVDIDKSSLNKAKSQLEPTIQSDMIETLAQDLSKEN